MPSFLSTGRAAAGLAAMILLAAACTDSAVPTTTGGTTAPPVATTLAPLPDVPVPDPGTAPSTTLAADVDPAVAAAVEADIAELVEAVERIRGLEFLEPPNVTVLSEAALAARVRADLAEEEPLVVEDRLFTLLGMLDPDIDLDVLIADLLAEQVLGFYDGDTGEMVVAGTAELGPLDRLTVVHELIHALTDQHFGFHERAEQLDDEERFDELSALVALVEGDATYFEIVYFQEELEFPDQLAIAELITEIDTAVFDESPPFLKADLEFPYDEGWRFVTDLVEAGGIAAVDEAYTDPPRTTENVLHPERFFDAQGARPVELPPTPIPGYEVYEESTFGEWGATLLFVDGDGRALAEQVGDGWGGDRYRVLTGPQGEVVLVWWYVADRERDAIEVAQALIRLAETEMGLGEGVESGGGLLYDTAGGYAFIDRIGDELVFIAAEDPAAGAAARAAVFGG